MKKQENEGKKKVVERFERGFEGRRRRSIRHWRNHFVYG
jgi:hypothetical protein